MKVKFKSDDIDFGSEADLFEIIPLGARGEVVNFGQGEGQIRIEGTVWGVYVSDDGNYYAVFEEGVLSPSAFNNLVKKIGKQLESKFGSSISIEFLGSLSDGQS